MTRSNRTLNRVLLAVVGLLALALAALAVWPIAAPLLHDAAGVSLPATPASALDDRSLTPAVLWSVAGGTVAVLVLCLAWVLTRGRGRTTTAVRAGALEIDVHVVEQLLRQALGSEPEIVAVAASAHRVRRVTAVRLRVDARRGADLRRVVDAVDLAVERLDARLGAELPLLVHVTSGLRASLARERRAA
jgi:hypothetical protein